MGGAILQLPVGPRPMSSWANHQRRGTPSTEPGTDFYCPIGTPILAPADGRIYGYGTSIQPATGRWVGVDFDNGMRFRAMHLSTLKRTSGRVKRGEVIGYSGASGYGEEDWSWNVAGTGGAHVHVTLWPSHMTRFGYRYVNGKKQPYTIDFMDYADRSGGAGVPEKPKEIHVEPYNRTDKPSRNGGRTVAPGETFKLDDTHGGGGKNIVGGVGPYAIVTHVYAEGTPGDSVELHLERFARGETPSKHYVERAVFDRNGLVRANPGFQLEVKKGDRVFVAFTALSTNADPVKVTLLDSDAYLYTVA